MASFSLGHFLHTYHSSSTNALHIKKPTTTRTKFLVLCRSQGGRKGDMKQENHRKKWWAPLMDLRESLMSPRNKGDWKDLVLMSFSFAVYVYISQRLVSAYCSWISILKQSL